MEKTISRQEKKMKNKKKREISRIKIKKSKFFTLILSLSLSKHLARPVVVQTVNPLGVEGRRAADDAMHFVALVQQQLRQVTPILASHSCHQRDFPFISHCFCLDVPCLSSCRSSSSCDSEQAAGRKERRCAKYRHRRLKIASVLNKEFFWLELS